MGTLVRCTDTTVTVALESKLEVLMQEGLITAYLGPRGWVPVKSKSSRRKMSSVQPSEKHGNAFVSPL